MMQISQRARAIQPSVTLELTAKARQLRDQGIDVLNLSVGEPDLPTPSPVVEAAHRALDEGHFHYTPTPGVPVLRRLIAERYAERLGLPLTPDGVMVTNGAKQALFNALATVTDPGDRIGILQPYWVTYAEQAHALGCEPVFIPCPAERDFRPDLGALKRELALGLRVVVVNSPCNPTGAAYGRADWEPFLDLLLQSSALLVSDEIYEDIVYTAEGHVSPLQVRPELLERCCLVSGLSKAYAMTGWRVGYSIAPLDWTKRMSALQGHTTSNINAIAQQAAIAALERPDLVTPMVDTFHARRERVCARLEGLEGVRARRPEGTFYLYMDISEQIGPSGVAKDVDELAARLLEEHHLALVPGSAFGDPHHLRLSFAAADEILMKAFDRLEAAFR